MKFTATTTSKVIYGLDAESDVDDGVEAAVTHRAVPLVGRSGTPLASAYNLGRSQYSSDKRSSISGSTIPEEVEETQSPLSE